MAAVKFTAQEEYGLRCLLGIAREPTGFLRIREIAKREALTPAYVAKLMRALRQAGLVTSVRGQKGGYRLARPADEINVGSVLAALGGQLYTKDFCKQYAGSKRTCVHNPDCSIRSLWMAVDRVVQRALRQTMLKDLICTERAMDVWLRAHITAAEGGPAEPSGR
jgi:Rrf2 family protein